MFQPINLGIIIKNIKCIIQFDFIKNNYVSSILITIYYLN